MRDLLYALIPALVVAALCAVAAWRAGGVLTFLEGGRGTLTLHFLGLGGIVKAVGGVVSGGFRLLSGSGSSSDKAALESVSRTAQELKALASSLSAREKALQLQFTQAAANPPPAPIPPAPAPPNMNAVYLALGGIALVVLLPVLTGARRR